MLPTAPSLERLRFMCPYGFPPWTCYHSTPLDNPFFHGPLASTFNDCPGHLCYLFWSPPSCFPLPLEKPLPSLCIYGPLLTLLHPASLLPVVLIPPPPLWTCALSPTKPQPYLLYMPSLLALSSCPALMPDNPTSISCTYTDAMSCTSLRLPLPPCLHFPFGRIFLFCLIFLSV